MGQEGALLDTPRTGYTTEGAMDQVGRVKDLNSECVILLGLDGEEGSS